MENSSISTKALACLLVLSAGHAAIWYVHPDSTLNSIQTALNGCSAHDTVLVGPGIYYENIVWPDIHGIDLIGELGPDSTIIDGGSAGSVIVVANRTDTSTTIKHFTIRNGYAHIGGGILCANHSAPTILCNVITGNATSSTVYNGGAGIACVDTSAPFIVENTILNNSAHSSGGGIMCNHHSSPHIVGNTIDGNTAWYGGGIFCHHNSSPVIIGNVICHNHFQSVETPSISPGSFSMATNSPNIMRTAFQGGGICLWQGCTSLVEGNSVFSNSTMGLGGGIACFFGSPTIHNNIVTGNIANDYGGGIACLSPESAMSIWNNTITANEAQFGGGISVLHSLGQLVIINNNTVSANDSDGIFCDNGEPVIQNNNITGNVRYGVHNVWSGATVNAENNWWGDSTGPYHPTLNPGGMGDTVSDYVDFEPWLHNPWGIEEQPAVNPAEQDRRPCATIISGPLHLPEGRECRIFDISGRVVQPAGITRGIYFLETDRRIIQKIVKVK